MRVLVLVGDFVEIYADKCYTLPTVLNKRAFMKAKFFGCLAGVFVVSGLLVACGQADKPKVVEQTSEATAFVGCYSIDKNQPAQIKISQEQNGFVMQMKEADGKQVWDQPEVLQQQTAEQGWQFFSTNAINLSKSDVLGVLARPDNVMAMAQVAQASANTNPMLDSPYVVHLLGAVNTIYQVPCDDVPIDFIKQVHQTTK